MSGNASNESPARPANELPLSPSTYYNSIPLTACLPLNVAREILQETIAHHDEEPLPTLPCTGLNVLHNPECTMADVVEVAEGLAAMIKNREDYYHLCDLLYEEEIAKLRRQNNDHPHNHSQDDD